MSLAVSLVRAVFGCLVVCLVACGGDDRVCVPGDQVQCRCGDGTWGYRTCRAQPQGGEAYSGCDCVIGLAPATASALSSPYMSGTGTGNGAADAGR